MRFEFVLFLSWSCFLAVCCRCRCRRRTPFGLCAKLDCASRPDYVRARWWPLQWCCRLCCCCCCYRAARCSSQALFMVRKCCCCCCGCCCAKFVSAAAAAAAFAYATIDRGYTFAARDSRSSFALCLSVRVSQWANLDYATPG